MSSNIYQRDASSAPNPTNILFDTTEILQEPK